MLILAMMAVMVLVAIIIIKVKYLQGNKINYYLVWKFRFSKEEDLAPTGLIIFQQIGLKKIIVPSFECRFQCI